VDDGDGFGGEFFGAGYEAVDVAFVPIEMGSEFCVVRVRRPG